MSKLGKVSKNLSENIDEELLLQKPVSVWKRTIKRLPLAEKETVENPIERLILDP